MKINKILLSTVLASSALMMGTAHADNNTRVAVGSALGGAGGAAVSADKRDRNGAAIGAALGSAGGYSVGKNMAGSNGGYIGAALGGGAGAVLGTKVSEDRRYDDRYDRRYDSRGYRYNDYRYNDRYRGDNGLHLGHYKNGKRR